MDFVWFARDEADAPKQDIASQQEPQLRKQRRSSRKLKNEMITRSASFLPREGLGPVAITEMMHNQRTLRVSKKRNWTHETVVAE